MKKTAVIVVLVVLALLASAGIISVTHNKKESNDKQEDKPLTEDNALLQEITALRAQIDQLEQQNAAKEFDCKSLQSEKEKLEEKSRTVEAQNQWLRQRNGLLGEDQARLQEEIAALKAEIELLEKERQEAVAQQTETDGLLAEEARSEDIQSEDKQPEDTIENVTSSEILSPALEDGQGRNILGIKIGGSDFDIEGTFALMPHWFLIADAGAVETPDDFVEDEFPGLTADNSFIYTVLFGTGLNWRINAVSSRPNFYIATMAGPAWYFYKDNGDNDLKTYLLWRSSVGFDMVLYKNLQFTSDVSFDWMKDYGFTPHLTVGLQWSFSNNWALFGR